MKALVIIPTYNEAPNLGELVRRIGALPQPPDLLVVDDGSTDGTHEMVEKAACCGAGVYLLQRGAKLGLASAYCDGLRWGLARGYDALVQMDGDLSHDPDDIPRLLHCLESGADLAIGSRYIGGVRVLNWPLRRLFLSVWAGFYVRLFSGLPVRDPTGGFRAWRAERLAGFPWPQMRARGYLFLVEMLYVAWRSGLRVEEVPIIFHERRQGQSKISRGIILESALKVPCLRLRRSLRLGPAPASGDERGR